MNRQPTTHIKIGFVAFCAAVAGIGGFLFGYDTAVINGANTFLQRHFQLDPKTDSLLIGLATASAIIGCVLGAMTAGSFSDRFGRRRVLFFCAVLYAVSGILSAVPERLALLTNLWHEIVGPGGGRNSMSSGCSSCADPQRRGDRRSQVASVEGDCRGRICVVVSFVIVG